MNIYQKMLLATAKIETVAKNLKIEMGKGSYKAVGEGDVLRAVKPIEAELGIYSYPISRKLLETATLTTVKEYGGNKTESNQLYMRIDTTYRFVNVENPEEYIETTVYGDGIDSGDKAPGKAMTYADKYALLKAYKIETGDDPDKEASQELKKVDEPKKFDNVKPKLATPEQVLNIQAGVSKETIDKALEYYKVAKLDDLTQEQAKALLSRAKK
jgi:hypothetical protein